MKRTFALIAVTGLLVSGCNPNNQSEQQESPPVTNEPAGAQPGGSYESPDQQTAKQITRERDWVGTNEAGRSTNFGISPGGANTRGTTNE